MLASPVLCTISSSFAAALAARRSVPDTPHPPQEETPVLSRMCCRAQLKLTLTLRSPHVGGQPREQVRWLRQVLAAMDAPRWAASVMGGEH